jgi:hypothetical protein
VATPRLYGNAMGAAPKDIALPSSPITPAKPWLNPWIVAAVVSLVAFMEVLDTSIANVALPYMVGELGASVDNSSWVLTSYLIANAEDDWFHSPLITTLAVIFPIAQALYLVWELTRRKPVLDLGMFKNSNFAGAASMIFVLGFRYMPLPSSYRSSFRLCWGTLRNWPA